MTIPKKQQKPTVPFQYFTTNLRSMQIREQRKKRKHQTSLVVSIKSEILERRQHKKNEG